MRPIKVAVVGTNIGCTLHVRALKAAGFEVAALVGRNPEVTAARAAHFGIPRSLGSIEAVTDSDVEAVVIATPPETHHEFVMKALAAGKHVLCEKPFSLDVAAAREMRAAAEAAGVANMVTHEFRWFAQNALMRQLVTSGRIGSPIQMTALFDHTLCAPATLDVPAWWRTHVGGGGWLRNYNAHGIDLIRYIAGDFAAVCGHVHPGADRDRICPEIGRPGRDGRLLSRVGRLRLDADYRFGGDVESDLWRRLADRRTGRAGPRAAGRIG